MGHTSICHQMLIQFSMQQFTHVPRKGSLPSNGSNSQWTALRVDPLSVTMRERSASLPMNSLCTSMTAVKLDAPSGNIPRLTSSHLQGTAPLQLPLVSRSLSDPLDDNRGCHRQAATRMPKGMHQEGKMPQNEASNIAHDMVEDSHIERINLAPLAFAPTTISISGKMNVSTTPYSRGLQEIISSALPRCPVVENQTMTGDLRSFGHREVGNTPQPSMLSPKCSLPSRDGHQPQLSGRSEKSFDLSGIPFNFVNAPAAASSHNSHGPYTPADSVVFGSAKRESDTRHPMRVLSVGSTRTRSRRSSQRSSKRSSRQISRLKAGKLPHERSGSDLAHLMASEPVKRNLKWKPIKVSILKRSLANGR